MGTTEPRGRGGRPRRHDPADPRHHRALRVRVPLQLVLPGDPAPVRRGDGPHARRVAGAGPPAPDPDPAEGARAASGGGGPGVHERLVDRLIAERRAQGGAADTTDLLGRMLTGVDRQSGEGLPDGNIRAQCITFLIAGHETTSACCLRDLLPPQEPRRPGEGAGRGRRGAGQLAAPTFEQVHRPTCRQVLDEALRLWPTHPASPDGPSRTRSSGAATPSRRTPRSRC